VRAAKDSLSSLLEKAAQGLEVIITSDGEPKAKLVPFKRVRKKFRVDWQLLNSTNVHLDALTSEELVRADRDGRP
jgi:prevent-host-death family protein